MSNPPVRSGNGELYALCGTVLGLGALVLIAVLFGSEPAQVKMLQFISSSVPVILGYAFIQRKQTATAEATGSLAGSLNGKLDARFANMENRLTDKIAGVGVTIPADTVSISPTVKDDDNV